MYAIGQGGVSGGKELNGGKEKKKQSWVDTSRNIDSGWQIYLAIQPNDEPNTTKAQTAWS